jgi:hypothetical protein
VALLLTLLLLLLLQGLEQGLREGIRVRPQAMLEAKDLPQNNLSMLLEQRVNRKLEEDRQARAMQQVRHSCRDDWFLSKG